MKICLHLPTAPASHVLALAQAADRAGYYALSLPDSVFFPENVSADYPYSADGERFWPSDMPYVDPFVAIPAMAAVTRNLRFFSNVLKVPIRQPLLVAKTVGSTAAMFP